MTQEIAVTAAPGNPWLDRLADRINHWTKYVAKHPGCKGTVDFEGRSACDLRKHGSWLYSKHPTTEAMCLSYKLPGYKECGRWHMAHHQHLISQSPDPEDLLAYVLAGGLLEAHNAFFERVIWKHVMVLRHGWPEVGHLQWRCSAAKASAVSLPRSLEQAVLAMKLPIEKDMVGNALMRKMCRPRKPKKSEVAEWQMDHGDEPMPLLWHEDEADLYRLWDYCDTDVLSEEALSDVVPDLSPEELAVWQMDQALNERGTRFDLELARAALDMATKYKKVLNAELKVITGVSSGTKRQAVRAWLLEHESLDLPDTKADTIDWYIKREPLSARCLKVLGILVDVNRTSTRKYQTMLDKADPDDWRIRDLLMYCGANTGRWAGKGVQVHNFPARELMIGGKGQPSFDEAVEDIKSGDVDWCIAMYGDVMKLLSHALRGAIISPPDRDLMVADYAAIEARNVLWLAGAKAALEIFIRGDDIYCDMATGIYGYEVIKGVHKKERQFGKQAILGLGYGMGFVTFLLTCRRYKIYFSREDVQRIMGLEMLAKYESWVRDYLCLDGPHPDMTAEQAKKYGNKKRQAAKTIHRLVDEREVPKNITHELALMKYTVDIYRNRYPDVKQLWKDQEAACLRAVTTGERVECGMVSWYVSDDGRFLHCELPSGRKLSYVDPEIKMVKTSWGEDKPALRYMRVNAVTNRWERTATYGGKVVENITQAVARDILTNAILLAYEGDTYEPSFHVHDELICEVDENEGSLDEFEELMSFVPPWAHGCPIAAEAERYKRYRK